MAKKKDAQYFYDEGVLRYEGGLKSAVNYFEKARELAKKDENTTHELYDNINGALYCCYGKVLKDYKKALFYLNKHLDSNPLNKEIKKAIDLRAKIQQEPEKYDEQTLLKIANNISVMKKEDDDLILAYIKYYILAQNPNCDEIFYLCASTHCRKHNYDAERNIKEAIKLNPKKQEYYDLYFDIIENIISDCEDDKERHKTIKKYDSKIREILNKSIFIKPTALNYSNLATYYRSILISQKSYSLKIAKEAIKALDKSIELDDRNSYIFDRRACIKSEIEDYDGAIFDYEKSLELVPLEKYNYEAIANLYIKKGQKERAYQYLDGAISKFSDNIDFQLKLWDIKIRIADDNNDSELASKDAQALIDNKDIADIDKDFAYVFKAFELRKAGKYEDAIKILDFLISFNSEEILNSFVYYLKATLLGAMEKYDEAIDAFEIADNFYRKEYNDDPNEKPNELKLNYAKGYCYDSTKQYALALRFYNKAIKNKENSWYPYRKKIGIFLGEIKPHLALKWCERAEKLYKKELDNGYYANKGIALFYLRDYKNAIKNLKKYPKYKEGKVLIAYCKYLLGDKENALKEIEKNYDKDKLDVALCCLAVIYTTKKEFEKALKTCDEIQEQDSDTDIIRAYIYKKMCDDSNSEKYLTLAVEKDEKKRTKEKLIKKFEYSSQVKFDE